MPPPSGAAPPAERPRVPSTLTLQALGPDASRQLRPWEGPQNVPSRRSDSATGRSTSGCTTSSGWRCCWGRRGRCTARARWPGRCATCRGARTPCAASWRSAVTCSRWPTAALPARTPASRSTCRSSPGSWRCAAPSTATPTPGSSTTTTCCARRARPSPSRTRPIPRPWRRTCAGRGTRTPRTRCRRGSPCSGSRRRTSRPSSPTTCRTSGWARGRSTTRGRSTPAATCPPTGTWSPTTGRTSC